MNMSKKNLYPEWKKCEYGLLDDEQIEAYLPLLKESCQLQIGNNKWIQYKLFESKFSEKTGKYYTISLPASHKSHKKCDFGGYIYLLITGVLS